MTTTKMEYRLLPFPSYWERTDSWALNDFDYRLLFVAVQENGCLVMSVITGSPQWLITTDQGRWGAEFHARGA